LVSSYHLLKMNTTLPQKTERLLSLDFYRGLIMVILVLGETDIFAKLNHAFNNSLTEFLATQFSHSKWHGLHLWDLLLPAFMLIAGVALAFSYSKQQQLGYTWTQSFVKVVKRTFWLLFWGVLIYSVRNQKLNLQFSNVLTELSLATLLAFLIIRLPVIWQLTVSLLCLLIPELLLRFTHIPGFDQPFVDQHNFANYIDLLVINRVNKGYGTTLNCLPSAAHTIWGMMAGQLLLSEKSAKQKSMYLAASGLLALIVGIALDLAGITPILKWIASSSFILVTGGISLIVLATLYLWIDVRKHQRYLLFFTIVGMNSIFIYLFFNFIGSKWMNYYIETLCSGLLSLVHIPVLIGAVISCLIIFSIEWYLCFFLYKKKIFFKL
jgi:predicted acyltransferase